MADLQLLLEAEKRGMLPPDKVALLSEARKRGLIQGEAKPVVSPDPTFEKEETSYLQHAGNLLAGAARGAGSIGATILAPWDIGKDLVAGKGLSLEANRERRKQIDEGLGLMGAETDSAMYKTGKIGAEIAGTAGVGGVLGNTLRAASSSPKVAAMADALASYGMGKGGHAVGYIPRVAAGGAAGGSAAALVNPDEVKMGAAVGAAIPAVAPIARFGGNLIANATGPMRESWRTSQGRKFLDEMLGSGATKQKVIQAIARGQGAGRTTVADDIAAANLGQTEKFGSPLVAIEEKLATQAGGLSDIAKSTVAGQEAGRMSGLEVVKPDLAKAVAARSAIADPLYEAARLGRAPVDTTSIVANIDDMLTRNVGNKRLVKEFNNIRSGLVDADGNLRTNAEQVSSAMDSLKAAIANQKNKFIQGELVDLKNKISKAIPGYEKAQQAFAGASPPVNQSTAIQAMQDILSGQGGAERASAFQNVLGRGEAALLKKSTGFPRYTEVGQVLNQPQMNAVTKVSQELARDAERARLGASVDTKHLFEIADKTKGTVSFPTLLSRPAMLANWVMKKVGHGADEMITQDMGKLMLSDPAAFSAKYLKDIPVSHRKQAFDVLMQHYAIPAAGVSAPVVATQ